MGHREKFLINGQEAPSVTTVLNIVRKEFLERWRGKLGNAECDRIVRESQELGQRLHEAIEGYFQGETSPELNAHEAGMFSLFKGWILEERLNPVELERHVKSDKYLFHGTTDVIGTFGDKDVLSIGDWKTSSAIDPLYFVQLSAYAEAYYEETGNRIANGFIVRADKKLDAKKPFEVQIVTDLPRYFPVFLNCLELYNFVNKKGMWTKGE